jgi:polyphosphate kinase
LLNIPSDFLPRFIPLPKIGDIHYYIALDDIILENLNFLFTAFTINGCYSIKLNRDAELNIDDEYSGDLVKKIKKQITKRNIGTPSRFLYDHTMPDALLNYLTNQFELEPDDIVPGGRYHNMHDLFGLGNPLSPALENATLEPLLNPHLEKQGSIFDAIDRRDVLLHFPYQTYDYVLRFFNEAALDPFVKEIKATFYRIAPESFICNALISAANNGKQVTVFVEIKARFDEQNNLKWAERMEEAGIKIIYSMPGLKVHAKVAMVIRSKDGESPVHYGYFGTGNFNEKTAAIYADQALLTKHMAMTNELNSLFDYLCDQDKQPQFNHLIVSQFNIIDKFTALIDREIAHARQGRPSYIIIKLNNIQDNVMIDKLYEASNAGVKIDMIVRAICCLKPGVDGQSENITVHRIVDGYLEHSRVFYFNNDGAEELYQGSADWMKRNLYRRIEVVFPVLDETLRGEVKQMLTLQLQDNVKGVILNHDLINQPFESDKPVRSQTAFYQWLSERASED